MGKKPIEQVPFGKFVYDRSTKTIHKLLPGPPGIEDIEVANYTALVNGRRYFSDSKLALEMFREELENSTFEVLEGEPRWVAAQIGAPFLELMGKLYHPNPNADDNQNFKYAAKRLIPRSAIEPAVNNEEYEEIMTALWHGLRCGVSHLGFMQAAKVRSIDIQVNEDDDVGPPIILYSKDHSEKVAELCGKAFADVIIKGLNDLLSELENDASLRENRFLPIWQQRWGTYAP
jgi:hypothetical protein